MTAEEGRWDYVEGDEPEQQTHDYDPDELERARQRMNAEKDTLDKEGDLFTSSDTSMDYQKGQEEIPDNCAICGSLKHPSEGHWDVPPSAREQEEDEGWGDPEDTAKDIYDLGHPEKAEEDEEDKCENCERAEDFLNDDGLCEDCEREAGIDRMESMRDAYEGGVGSGRKPEGGKPALLPEQTARAQITPHYDPFRATPQSQRLQTDPELSRMTEEAPDDIDPIFGKEYDVLDPDEEVEFDDEKEWEVPEANEEDETAYNDMKYKKDTLDKLEPFTLGEHPSQGFDYQKGQEDVSISGPPAGTQPPANMFDEEEDEESPASEGMWMDDDFRVGSPTLSDVPDIAKSMAKGYYNQIKRDVLRKTGLQEVPQWEKDLQDLSEAKAGEGVVEKVYQDGWEFSVIDSGYGGGWGGTAKGSDNNLEVAIFSTKLHPTLGIPMSQIKGWLTQDEVDELKRAFQSNPESAYKSIGGEAFDEDEHPRGGDSENPGRFSAGSGGSSGGKHSDMSEKDLIKSIKGGSKDWNDWGRNEKTEDAYAEIERRNKEIPTPKRPEGAKGTIFRDDPDAVSKMEAKVKYLEDVADYWKKVTKFPNRDYQNHDQLGDAKWYAMSNNSANLRDAKKKLEGIKAQQGRGTQLVRKTTYKSDQYGKSKPRFYYSEEPKKTHELTGEPMADLKTLSMFTQGDTVEIDGLTNKQKLKLHGLMSKEEGYGVNGSNDAEMKQFWDGLSPQKRIDFGMYPEEKAQKSWDELEGHVSEKDSTGTQQGGKADKGMLGMMVNKTNDPTMSDYWNKIWTDKGKPDYSGMESYANEVSYDYNDIGGEKRKVTYTDNRGQTRTGRAVMKGPAGWVVSDPSAEYGGSGNIVGEDNFVSVESKATEEQINSDTYYYDYSDYWNKGNSYVRSGLALQAGIPTDWAETEWDDLPADVQAKIKDAGYVTSYESYESMSWDLLPRGLQGKLSEGFTPASKSDWDTMNKEDRKDKLEEVSDEEIPILTQLLENEEEEQEKGDDEEEDIALIAQLLDPEADESFKKKLTEFEDSDRPVSPNTLQRYSEPIDLPTGKNALDQTYGVSEPETPDGQDLTGITIGENGDDEEEIPWSGEPFLTEEENKYGQRYSSDEYDPSGEKDAIDTDSDKISDFFKQTGDEEIIEQKPFKPTYLYYKQYPFGRRAGKQNPFGEVYHGGAVDEGDKGWYCNKCNINFESEAGAKAHGDAFTYHLVREYSLSDQAKHDAGESYAEELDVDSSNIRGLLDLFGDMNSYINSNPSGVTVDELKNKFGSGEEFEFNLDDLINGGYAYREGNLIKSSKPKELYESYGISHNTMDRAHKWWDNKFPDRPWKDMRIGDRQHAILAFLNDPNTKLSEAKAEERDFYTSNKEITDQAREIMAQEEFGKSLLELNQEQLEWIEDIMNDYGNTLNPADKPSSEAKEFESPLRDQFGTPFPTPEGIADCTFCGKVFDNWDLLGDHITIVHNDQGRTREFYNGNAPSSILNHPDWTGYAGEGGKGSGRKQYKSEDPKTKDKAHIGWKNYGIDDYIDKAEKEYSEEEDYRRVIDEPRSDMGRNELTDWNQRREEEYNTDEKAKDYLKKIKHSIDQGGAKYQRGGEQLEDPTPWVSLAHLAGTTVKDILFPAKEQEEEEDDGLTIANSGHRSTHSDYYKNKEAKEGGLGSGKKDHKGWMRAIEEEHTYDFCENCSMITEQVNKKCEMCGKKVE